MKDQVIEHEILRALFVRAGFSITKVGTEAEGMIPIYKRTYDNCILQYGTLVDILNNPEKYKKRPEEGNTIFYWQEKITRDNEIIIKDFGWYQVSDALELMAYNKHVKDSFPETPFVKDITNRKITLTYDGVV